MEIKEIDEKGEIVEREDKSSKEEKAEEKEREERKEVVVSEEKILALEKNIEALRTDLDKRKKELGEWKLIQRDEFSGATTKTWTFPPAWSLVRVEFMFKNSVGSDTFNLRLNGITSANYYYLYYNGATPAVVNGASSFFLATAPTHPDSKIGGELLFTGQQDNNPIYRKSVAAIALYPRENALIKGMLYFDNNPLSSITIYAAENAFSGIIRIYGKQL